MDQGAPHEDFEEQGEDQVRLLLSSGAYDRAMRVRATEWLKQKRQEGRAAEAAVHGERVAEARKATTRRRLATLAVLVAGSAAVVGAVVWLFAWLAKQN